MSRRTARNGQRERGWARALVHGLLILLVSLLISDKFEALAQGAPELLQPGEAYVTRFSGTTRAFSGTVLDTNGTVGSIVDLRGPGQAPRGQHWINEPQRLPVTAGQVGQVFGVALDDASPPNVYLTATSAFGLHRTNGNAGWQNGMWGQGGGPGTVWKLDAANGYQPSVFAEITLNGRANSGAALGNIAFDKHNKQLFVSDLETGMIHRLKLADGSELGRFDHGTEGRASFFDAGTGAQANLPAVAFDPNSSAGISNCSAGTFERTPECWNFADFRRRVWGLGVHKNETSGEVRLYYAVWSSQGFGNPDHAAASDEEKRNATWSIALAADGSFDKTSVRREFFLPDFFTNPADIARAGRSHPVSDISFPKCTLNNAMVVAERGGIRNLGLEAVNPFAAPHESRVLRYERNDAGVWQLAARYDVGFYDRKAASPPYIRANSSGGASFGYGYDLEWLTDAAKIDQFVWMTGDGLCSPNGPCYAPESGRREDGSHVHGAQGTPEFAHEALVPQGATQPYPPNGEPYPATGPLQSYMFDTDINLDAQGNYDLDSLVRNDATKIGDIEICYTCDVPPPVVEENPPVIWDDPPIVEDPPGTEGPDLEKQKTGPAQCVEGGICTFTITITNLGPGDWSGPLWELDTLPPGATLWNYGPQPQWLCNQVFGTQDVICTHDWVNLAPGASVTLTVDVLMPFGIAGQIVENCVADIWLPSRDPNDPAVIRAIEQVLAGYGYPVGPIDGILDIVTQNGIAQFQFDNGLPATGIPDQTVIDLLFPAGAGRSGDLNPANDGDCHQVLITPAAPPPAPAQPDIEIRKTQVTGQCRPNGLCTFRFGFINRGPGDWTGRPAITDTLPPGATLVNPPPGCAQAGNSFTCTYPRDVTIPPGQGPTLTLDVRMPANLRPGARNCVNIRWQGAADPNAANDQVCIPIRVAPPPAPDIEARKRQVGGHCDIGGVCSFELWFINRGPGNFRGSPRLVDRLPAGAVLQPGASAPWTCSQSGTSVTCRRPAIDLPPGKATKVTIKVRLPKDMKPGTRNCVRIQTTVGGPRDPVPQNNEHCIPIDASPPAKPPAPPPPPKPPAAPVHTPTVPAQPVDIGVQKTQLGTCKPGGICTFELKFINGGPGTWTGQPVLGDIIPVPGVTVKSWFPQSWTRIGGSNNDPSSMGFVHAPVQLPPGGSVSLTINIQIPHDLHSGPGVDNCAITDPVSINTIDLNPANNRHCIPVIIEPEGFTPKPPAVVTPHTHCPKGTIRQEGECVKPEVKCPAGTIKQGGKCVKPTLKCPKGYTLRKGKCYKPTPKCPKGYTLRNGKCYKPAVRCPAGTVRRGDACVRVVRCPPGTIQVGPVCVRINTGPIYRPPSGGHHD